MLITSLVFCFGCSVGRHHTADSVLEERFFQHRVAFESLLQDIRSNQRIGAIHPDMLIYGGHWFDLREAGTGAVIERAGMTTEQLSRFEEQLLMLGLKGGVMQGHGEVEFRADQGSVFNGDSYKGYVFRELPPDHILRSLDGYRISEGDRNSNGDWVVYKSLADKWYLYLFVNR